MNWLIRYGTESTISASFFLWVHLSSVCLFFPFYSFIFWLLFYFHHLSTQSPQYFFVNFLFDFKHFFFFTMFQKVKYKVSFSKLWLSPHRLWSYILWHVHHCHVKSVRALGCKGITFGIWYKNIYLDPVIYQSIFLNSSQQYWHLQLCSIIRAGLLFYMV